MLSPQCTHSQEASRFIYNTDRQPSPSHKKATTGLASTAEGPRRNDRIAGAYQARGVALYARHGIPNVTCWEYSQIEGLSGRNGFVLGVECQGAYDGRRGRP